MLRRIAFALFLALPSVALAQEIEPVGPAFQVDDVTSSSNLQRQNYSDVIELTDGTIAIAWLSDSNVLEGRYYSTDLENGLTFQPFSGINSAFPPGLSLLSASNQSVMVFVNSNGGLDLYATRIATTGVPYSSPVLLLSNRGVFGAVSSTQSGEFITPFATRTSFSSQLSTPVFTEEMIQTSTATAYYSLGASVGGNYAVEFYGAVQQAETPELLFHFWVSPSHERRLMLAISPPATQPQTGIVDAPIHVNQLQAGIATNPVAARLSNGNLVLAWQQQNGVQASTYSLMYRIYDPSGAPVTDAITIDQEMTSSVNEDAALSLSADQLGGFLIAWRDADSSLRLAETTADGQITATPEIVTPSFSNIGGLTHLANNRAIITWDFAGDVFARVFNVSPGFRLSVSHDGLGAGQVRSLPAGIDCPSGGQCEAFLPGNTRVLLLADSEFSSRFDRWSQPCEPSNTICSIVLTGATDISARFELRNVGSTEIYGAVLPNARSTFIGGPSLTVFYTVAAGRRAAQACRISNAPDAPFRLEYRTFEDGVIGSSINPEFDLSARTHATFVLELFPVSPTAGTPFQFAPSIECQNATLEHFPSISTLSVSIEDQPSPDVLSIIATPDEPGIVRYSRFGEAGFLTVAAMNIGAGDGTLGNDEARVTVTVDTGSTRLPVNLRICETDSRGACLTPLQGQIETTFAGSTPKFFAVFVTATSDGFVRFDPAQNRIYVRMADGNGTERSVSSVAIATK